MLSVLAAVQQLEDQYLALESCWEIETEKVVAESGEQLEVQ